MSTLREVSRSLKDALYETLTSILSSNHELRMNAEQQISVLEVTDEFAIHLTELVLNTEAPLAIRQLASVLLKQYVECHWCGNSEKFRAPETTSEAKAAVRALLPMGLQESISKLRNSVAYAISAIAQWDWPQDWPELFNILVQSLATENSFAVHGAMRVLKELSLDVSDAQMPQFAPIILPEMLKIFLQDEKYGVRTRGRAVEIFSTCVEMVAAMSAYNKSAAKTLLFPVLTPFVEALVSALKIPNGSTSDSGLKKDILNTFRVLVKFFPKQMSQWLTHILQPVWNLLTESANQYVCTVVNDSDDTNNPVDSDGEVLGFESLVFSIFDFVYALVESSKYRQHIESVMTDLIYYILLYMQITVDQIKVWNTDPDQFVQDEDDDSYTYSIRIYSQDLLVAFSQELEDQTAIALCSAVSRHIHENSHLSNPNWWKVHESCMLALGCLKNLIVSQVQKNSLQFDMTGFLHNVVIEDLNSGVSPYLYGRCLWFASCYTNVMTENLVKRFLQATVSGLQPTQHPSIRISAVRAILGFCKLMKKSKNVQVLEPYLPTILEGLICLSLQFSSEVLALVLESLSVVISIDHNFTAQMENKISPIAIAVFLKHNSDPVLVRITQEIFQELCKNPGAVRLLQQRLIPTLVSILQAQPLKVPLGLQAVALDILETIVRSSSIPLSEPLITQAFPGAIHCIMHTDDNSVLQNGGECLRAYISVALDQVSAWHDEMGKSGLDYIINVTERLLDPKTPESAASFVGRLVSILITKASNILGERSKLILKAVLSKIQQVEQLSVSQSLILVFAHLINQQIEPILDFLSGVPGPSGQSALEFILDLWCQCHPLFFGAYEKKISICALTLILQYGLKGNDQLLQSIHVKGDQIFNHGDGPKTRSKSLHNPEQWTTIPLLIKIYKLLISELSNICDQGMENQDEESSDEEIEGCENNGDASGYIDGAGLQCMISDCDLVDEEEEDPDIISDPVYSLNLKAYLTDYLQQLSQLPCHRSFTEHLTPSERNMLQDLGLPS